MDRFHYIFLYIEIKTGDMPRPNTGRTGGSGGVDISNVISKGAGKIKKKSA